MKKIFALIVAALLGAVLVACGPAAKSGTRISMIVEGQYVQRFFYDNAGNLVKIIENDAPDDVNTPNHNVITFNADGSIASVTTDHEGMNAEVIDGDTWRLYSDYISFTITYDENHRVVELIVDVDNMVITDTTKRDASGRALSRTNAVEYADGSAESGSNTVNFVYDYDDAGNYIVQYYEDEFDGACFGEVYCWE